MRLFERYSDLLFKPKCFKVDNCVVSLAAFVRVGPKLDPHQRLLTPHQRLLTPHQRLLTRTTHSIPFVQWTNKIRALINAKIKRQPLASDEASIVVFNRKLIFRKV